MADKEVNELPGSTKCVRIKVKYSNEYSPSRSRLSLQLLLVETTMVAQWYVAFKFTVRPNKRIDIKLESIQPLENEICMKGDVLRWRFL